MQTRKDRETMKTEEQNQVKFERFSAALSTLLALCAGFSRAIPPAIVATKELFTGMQKMYDEEQAERLKEAENTDPSQRN